MAKKLIFPSPIWPALLSGLLAPGLGQIANRDYLKGIGLLVSSIGSLSWFSSNLTEQLAVYLPGTPDQWQRDMPALKEAILKLVESHTTWFFTFHILILVIWGFSIVDAYLTAKERLKKANEDSDSDNGPSPRAG